MILSLLLAAVVAAPLQVHKPLGAEPEQAGDVAAKLVQRIQQDLSEVDKQLEQAAGEDQLGSQLKEAREAHVRAIAGLEDLIKQIKYRRSKSPSSGGGGGGGSTQSQPRGADDRSQAESAPQPQPQAQGKPETGDQQQRGGQQPKDGQPDPSQGAQRDGQQPPPDAVSDFLRSNTDARWGVLPPKMQERLLNLHVEAIPERYRAWLAAYVRELNRRDGTSP